MPININSKPFRRAYHHAELADLYYGVDFPQHVENDRLAWLWLLFIMFNEEA